MTSSDATARAAPPTRREAARFLMQATLGASLAEIDRVAALGFEAWIDAQFALKGGVTHPELRAHRDAGRHCEIHHAWWRQILTADDHLRQRLAVALTEIFVVSETAIEFVPWEMMKYYDELGKLAFGNWRDLLRMVTFSPMMGHYLSHLHNRKADPAVQRYPDENFAREIMQLFSIGLWKLNPDGTRQRDPQGREIPTYDNTDVGEFARVFTGLGFGGPHSDVNRPDHFLNSPPNYEAPMEFWEEEHDQGEKWLLRGMRLPAFSERFKRRAVDDLEDALDNIFHHPNVGPFFGRLLIQRLVTSNPSPGYVRRVAEAFANNGRAVRGDMRAVIRAILLDPEAREPGAEPVRAGRLHEPYLRYVRLARTFQARSEAGSFKVDDHDTLLATNQILLNSPTVFNFFLPDHQPPGPMSASGLCGPEFQIMTSTTAITSLNHYTDMLGSGFGDAADGPERMRLDFAEEIALADDPEALIELLGLKMAAGALEEETKNILRRAYAELPASYAAEDRVKAIAQLIAISPDFAVFQ